MGFSLLRQLSMTLIEMKSTLANENVFRSKGIFIISKKYIKNNPS